MTPTLQDRLRHLADHIDDELDVERPGSALPSSGPRRPSRRRRLLALAAAAVIVVVGVAALVWARRQPAGHDLTPTQATLTSSTTATTPDPSIAAGTSFPAVVLIRPPDLVYRGGQAAAASVPVPSLYLWSPDATVAVNVATEGFDASVARTDDVEAAIQDPRLDADGMLGIDWYGPDGAVLSIVATNVDRDVVGDVARQVDIRHRSNQSLREIVPPPGLATFTPSTVLLDGQPAEAVRLRWSNDDDTRGAIVDTHPALPPIDYRSSPGFAERGGRQTVAVATPPPLTRVTAVRMDTALEATVTTWGLTELEHVNLVAGLLPQPAPPADTAVASHPAAPVGPDATYAQGTIDGQTWALIGRSILDGDTIRACSGLRPGDTEDLCSTPTPPEPMLITKALPVGNGGVLVVWTPRRATAAAITFTDANGATLATTTEDQTLQTMVLNGHPPAAAFAIPAGAAAASLTLTDIAGTPLGPPLPISSADLVPTDSPG